jgi:hypothetical protein
LAALGTGGGEDEEQQVYAMAGAMELATGLLELTRIRKALSSSR